MQRSAQLPRKVAYERAERAMVTAALVVPPTLGQADEGVVLALDIAGMGRINARYGCPVGDRLLAAVEAALRQQFGGRGCVARLPGDQFVVVLPHRTATEHAIAAARQAVARVQVSRRWRRRTVVRAHVGAAYWNDDISRRTVLRTASARLKSTPLP
jgi:diguanylate cyclase (GGDEF)-like protein